MPTEYTDEERAMAERIKAHWRKHCRRLHRDLLKGGQESLDRAALNVAWDTLQQARGYVAAGMGREMAESEAWYGMVRDSQAMDKW